MKTKLPAPVPQVFISRTEDVYIESKVKAAMIEAYNEGLEIAAERIMDFYGCNPEYVVEVILKLKES